MSDTTPSWAIDLAHKLLKEAPENLPFWQIMANGLRDERSRCAGKARDILSMNYKYEDMQTIAHDTAEEIAQWIEDEE